MTYLVLADRYGTGSYVFPVGIFDTLEQALQASRTHKNFRGGKYDHRIYEIMPGQAYDAEECKFRWAHSYQTEV